MSRGPGALATCAWIVVVAVVLAAVGAAPITAADPTASAGQTSTHPSGSSAHGGHDPTPAPDFDRAFIDMMVPHHESAVAMAVVALARAEHAELLALAPEIIVAQEMEIAQLRTWREAWYGDRRTPPLTEMPVLPGVEMPGMDHGMAMDMTRDIRDLWTTEEPFDRAFIDAMIPHHQSAIDAPRIALEQAEHPEIQELAQAIIESQTARDR